MPQSLSTIRSTGGPLTVTPAPIGGAGGYVYCAHAYGVSCGDTVMAACELEFEVTSRSTIAIEIVWHAASPNFEPSWNFLPAPPSQSSLVSPQPFGFGNIQSVSTAATRDPGIYTIVATFTDAFGDTPQGRIMITVIVGSNTEDDCLTYQSGEG